MSKQKFWHIPDSKEYDERLRRAKVLQKAKEEYLKKKKSDGEKRLL